MLTWYHIMLTVFLKQIRSRRLLRLNSYVHLCIILSSICLFYISQGSALHTIDNRNLILKMKTFLFMYKEASKSSRIIHLSKHLASWVIFLSSYTLHVIYNMKKATSLITTKLLEANHLILTLFV